MQGLWAKKDDGETTAELKYWVNMALILNAWKSCVYCKTRAAAAGSRKLPAGVDTESGIPALILDLRRCGK